MAKRHLHRTVLAGGSGMRLIDVRCEGGAGSLTPWEEDRGSAAIIVRSGGFLREAEGQAHFVDPSGGFISRDGVMERFRFVGDGRDVCTVLGVSAEVHDEYLARHRTWRLVTDATFDIRHRRLVSAGHRGTDSLASVEAMLMLLEAVTPQAGGDLSGHASTRVAHRRLVWATQEALANEAQAASLDELAMHVSSSPHHLSRVFRTVTGETITAYRNKIRLRSVLEDIAAGETNFALLASRHGFADHAHLTRTVRRHTAHTPVALRRMLAMRDLR